MPLVGRRLLIVEDEPLFRRTLRDALQGWHGLSVDDAADGTGAMTALGVYPYDMVLTDLNMPALGGLELIRWMVEQGLRIPVMVMTAFGRPEVEASVRAFGVTYLEKPIELDCVRQIVLDTLERARTSHVVGLTLAGFVQLLSIERRTGVARVQRGHQFGTLLLRRGQLVDAHLGERSGIAAAMSILAWPEAGIHWVEQAVDDAAVITGSLESILLDATRCLDEARRDERTRPAVEEEEETAGAARRSSVVDRAPRAEAEPIDARRITECLGRAMEIEGAIGAALVDLEREVSLGSSGGGHRLDIERAASAACGVVRAQLAAIEALALGGPMEDLLVTLDDQLHLIRPSERLPGFFLLLSVDRRRGNLGMARLRLMEVVKGFLA